jgi:hypothetical protein
MRRVSAGPKETASRKRGVVGRDGGPTDRGENGLTPASNRGRQRRRTRRTSKYISKHQATNLIEALDFADAIGCPLNFSVDISWVFFSGSVDDWTRFARWQQRLSKWTKRRGFPLTMIWTREVGKRGGAHTHVLLHIPPWLMESADFRRDFRPALERAFKPEDGPHDAARALNIQRAHFPDGKLRYNLKGIDPKHAEKLGVHASDQGDLDGKRVGCTQHRPKARGKAWRACVGSGRPGWQARRLYTEHQRKS